MTEHVLRKIRVEESFEQPVPAEYRNTYVLAAGTPKAVTFPPNLGAASDIESLCMVIPTEDIWIRTDGTSAAVPTVDQTTGAGPVLVRKGDSPLLDISPSSQWSIVTSVAGAFVQLWLYTRKK